MGRTLPWIPCQENSSNSMPKIRWGFVGGGKIIPIAFTNEKSKILVLNDTETSTASVKSIDINARSEEGYFRNPNYDPYPQVIDDKLITDIVAHEYVIG